MTKWKGKRVAVFGLGKSGIAIARRLIPLGAVVFITENKPLESIDPLIISEIKNLTLNPCFQLETGGHTDKALEGAELIVLSPGVKTNIPIIQKACELGIPVISEVELAYRFLSKPIISVTGTNGKTTTATLIGEFLTAANKKVVVSGNIGIPLVSIDDKNLDFIVVEISSYQLETIVSFRPWISVILNLTEDHLERHENMKTYAKVKSRIFMNQRKTDYVIYNAEDPYVIDMVKGSEAILVPFNKKKPHELLGVSPSEIKIKGEHNLENIMASASAAKIAGVKTEAISKVLKTFPGVEHRIEFCGEKNGVAFYNDSKATNPDSTIVALKALDNGKKSIVLLLGGRDKNTDLSKMCGEIKKTVKKVVLIGEAAQRFAKALSDSGFYEYVFAEGFSDAINKAASFSKKGDIVLLSPACASFDMFSNFEERGRAFKSLAQNF